MKPVRGVCSLSVTLGSAYVALIIPTPLLLFTASNSTSPELRFPPAVTILTLDTAPPSISASNFAFSFTKFVLLLNTTKSGGVR